MSTDAIETKNTIVKLIKDFESKLDDNSEVALIINGTSFSPTAIAATENTNLIVFIGDTITCVQHVSQINYAIIAIQKKSPNKPPHRIGFTL